MYQEPLFANGKKRSELGQKKVLETDPNWSIRTAEKLENWLAYIIRTNKLPFFTGDDMRQHLIDTHTAEPHHPNAWSAVMGAAVRRWQKEGRIALVGFDLSKRPSRHASIVRIYKVL